MDLPGSSALRRLALNPGDATGSGRAVLPSRGAESGWARGRGSWGRWGGGGGEVEAVGGGYRAGQATWCRMPSLHMRAAARSSPSPCWHCM